MFGPSWQVNMDRSSHTSTKVGGARVDVAILLIQAEVLARLFLNRILHCLDTLCQPLKDSINIATLLHGNDTELILFIDPDQESLGSIVEDTTTLRPVSLHTSNSQISVTRNKEEMVINELLADRLRHASQWVVFSSKIAREVLDGILHQSLNTKTLFLGNSRRETKSINGTSNTNSS